MFPQLSSNYFQVPECSQLPLICCFSDCVSELLGWTLSYDLSDISAYPFLKCWMPLVKEQL